MILKKIKKKKITILDADRPEYIETGVWGGDDKARYPCVPVHLFDVLQALFGFYLIPL